MNIIVNIVTIWLLTPVWGIFSVYSDLYSSPQYILTIDPEDLTPLKVSEIFDSYLTDQDYTWEYMRLANHSYLCCIPRLNEPDIPHSQELDAVQEELELSRAKSHALQLLQPLTSSCLYHPSGYWTYSFCFGNDIQQFHQGVRQLDQAPEPETGTQSFVLGRFDAHQDPHDEPTTSVQSIGDVNYFVQQLGGGSVCDLTGHERTIEVQYFCNDQSTSDFIAWVKEIKSCHYQIAIHTKFLCDEVVFQPPTPTDVHEISCKRIPDGTDVKDLKLRYGLKELDSGSTMMVEDLKQDILEIRAAPVDVEYEILADDEFENVDDGKLDLTADRLVKTEALLDQSAISDSANGSQVGEDPAETPGSAEEFESLALSESSEPSESSETLELSESSESSEPSDSPELPQTDKHSLSSESPESPEPIFRDEL